MKSLIFGMLVALFCGCTPFGGFGPPPNIHQLYEKKGLSDINFGKVLLECGYENPYDGDSSHPSDEYLNQEPNRQKCMAIDGFIYKGTPVCKISYFTNTPACQPNAVVPTRNVERRLNSVFCKQYPRAQVCQPSGQEVVPQTGDTTPPKTFVPQSRSTEQANQLQGDIQKQNNRQMNNMLKNTAPKMKR